VTGERASETVVMRSNPAKDVYHLLAVVVAVVTIAALYFARVVLIPFALAVLFTFILTPVVRLLERVHLGRAFSSLLVVFLTLATCAGLGWAVSKQFGQVVNEVPSYKVNIKEKLATLHWSESHILHNASETVTEISKDLAAKPAPSSSDSAHSLEPTRSTNNRPATPAQPVPVQVISPPSLPLESMQSILGLLARALIVVVFTIFVILILHWRTIGPLCVMGRHRTLGNLLRWWLFFALKSGLLVALAWMMATNLVEMAILRFGIIVLQYASGATMWLFLAGLTIAMRWSIRDQASRCRTCLKRLGTAIVLGSSIGPLSQPSGFEFLCESGHGLLHVPASDLSCLDSERWTDLDESWREVAQSA